jgi:hypothetical protein
MINPINISAQQAYQKTVETKVTHESGSTTKSVKSSDVSEMAVKLEIGTVPEGLATYNKPKPVKGEPTAISELQRQADEAMAPLRQMVEELLKKQGMAFKESGVRHSEDDMVDITPEMRAEAQKLIGEGGEYSVENTANRLVDFAKAISNGDPSKLELLKENIQKGFDEAEKAFGGTLPDISKQTLELTMKKLDDWASEL